MIKSYSFSIFITVFFFSIISEAAAQASDSLRYRIVIAGAHYKKNSFYQKLWGKHYRKEWSTPVRIPVVMLDTLEGGLTPYAMGGSRQTKSLRLRDKNEREYVLRSIDKTFSGVLPPVAKNSFIEVLADDQTSIGHPYSALTIAPMAEAIGVYHTNPRIYYVPAQKALGKFNDSIADQLYLFEQRPDEDWRNADNFGNPEDIKSTDKMLLKIHEDNDRSVDAEAFLRVRLFDMIIGDWGRHEDQWRWGEFKEGKKTIYKPIARDRDQAYTLFDGYLVGAAKRAGRINHLQSFGSDISNVNAFNFPARNLDRHLLNRLRLTQWLEISADIQKRLTDTVIDAAVRRLPPEVYDISGPLISSKLKSRRDHLDKYAKEYYSVLAEELDITGSDKNELFEVNRLNDDSTEINIFKIKKSGITEPEPFYSRVVLKKETREVRLYGIGGEDEFRVTGSVKKGIAVRMIGGADHDKFIDSSNVRGHSHKTEIYDNWQNEFITGRETQMHRSKDSAVHAFKYKSYKFDKRGIKGTLFYSFDDRLFFGFHFLRTKNKWRKEPYGYVQFIGLNYSITQNAVSATYRSRYTKLIGNWDMTFFGNYDFVRWTNFYGLGNETKLVVQDRDFNRIRSHSYLASVGLERVINNKHRINVDVFYQGINIRNDTARFLAKSSFNNIPEVYKNNGFVGTDLSYLFQRLNDSTLPTRGVSFLTGANYVHNFNEIKKSFARFTSEVNFYLPITKKWGTAFKVAGATLAGTPVFYQYNNLGGSETLRGHRRERFYGNSSFYTQSELQWITPVRSYIYNGRLGFFGLYDAGRVWLRGEKSSKIHTSFGGGIILSPYNLLSASLSFAKSEEDSNIHIQLIKAF